MTTGISQSTTDAQRSLPHPPRLSVFTHAARAVPCSGITIDQLHSWITRNDAPAGGLKDVQALTAQLRAHYADHGKSDRYRKGKRILPIITPAGLFSRRRPHAFREHSGFVALDFDRIPAARDKEAAIETLSLHPAVALAARSVADGVWALVRVDPMPATDAEHVEACRAAAAALSAIAGRLDERGDGLGRFRFVAHDPDAQRKEPSAALLWKMPPPHAPAPPDATQFLTGPRAPENR